MIEDKSDLVDLLRLSIREIKAVSFAHLFTKPDYETFSLSLRDLDKFLGRPNFDIPDVLNPVPTLNVFFLHYIYDFYLSGYENRQQENLFKMTEAVFLAANTITKELGKYCHRKNVDPTTLLLERYHEFLDVFIKTKANTFPIH